VKSERFCAARLLTCKVALQFHKMRTAHNYFLRTVSGCDVGREIILNPMALGGTT
jgi:hypothetical protein